jgi:trigger factor
LKVEVINKNDCKKEVKIEVPAEDLKSDYDAVCARYQRQARVPGFRKGKPPLTIILQRFRNEIREDFMEASVQRTLVEALKSENLNPLDNPHIHDLEYSENQPLRFTAEFEVLPKLNIEEYKGIEIDKITVEVGDEEVEAAVQSMRERMAQFTPVENRPIENGDFAVISYIGKFADPTRRSLEAKEVYCEIGGSNTLAEFNDNLMGMQIGEERVFTVKYPDDFPNKELSGSEIQYNVHLEGIKLKQLPELGDDFARDAGQFSSLEDLRTKVREELTSNKQKTAQSDMQEKLVELIIERNPFDAPAVLVKKQAENRLNDYVRSLVARGIHPQTMDINWSEFQERQKQLAVTDVKVALVLEHLADKEKLSVSDEELDADIARRAEETQQSFEAVKSRLTKAGAADRLKDRIRNKKTLDFLLSHATLKVPHSIIVQP